MYRHSTINVVSQPRIYDSVGFYGTIGAPIIYNTSSMMWGSVVMKLWFAFASIGAQRTRIL